MSTVNKVTINDRSIEKASKIKDFKAAISEYIWNSFDAKATKVNISYTINGILGIEDVTVTDNGTGIDPFNLVNTFGLLLDSQKKSIAGSNVHGNKGNGRFSFRVFASQAVWKSVFEKEGKKYQFEITIKSNDKDNYSVTEPIEVNSDTNTGCKVVFYNLNTKISQIITTEFISHLKSEFGWLLQLRKHQGLSLCINDEPIDYASIIYKFDETTINIDTGKQSADFKVSYIEWKGNIGDRFYYNYFLDNDFVEKGKLPTTFNNNGIDFHHSIYVVSDYFKTFTPTSELETDQGYLFEEDEIFKRLGRELHKLLLKKQKDFIDRTAETLIKKLESENVFPDFEKTEIGMERKEEFINVTKSIFKLQPKLFIKVPPLQKKSFLGLLKLLVDSDERENIIKIIDAIVNDMSTEERTELVKLLETTKINNIVRTVKQVVGRVKSIEILKLLVLDFEKYTNERDHIQKVMEDCFWLFGEQYTLATADKDFVTALKKYYIDILNKSLIGDEKLVVDSEEKNRRPDLFLCRQSPLTPSNVLMEENIIVELKRPDVEIGMKQYRQIEDYMNLIINTPQFNGETRIWKFYIVGKNISKEVEMKVRQRQEEGKEQFLADEVGKYKIFVIKWDDLFQSFKLKNDFLLKNLKVDKDTLLKELTTAGIPNSEMPQFLTDTVIAKGDVVSPITVKTVA